MPDTTSDRSLKKRKLDEVHVRQNEVENGAHKTRETATASSRGDACSLAETLPHNVSQIASHDEGNRLSQCPRPGKILLSTKHPTETINFQSTRSRRPELRDAWYSHLVPDLCVDWAKGTLSPRTKRNLSNVGNIEETVAGITSPERCSHCSQRGYDCNVYGPWTVDLYCRQSEWRSCSR